MERMDMDTRLTSKRKLAITAPTQKAGVGVPKTVLWVKQTFVF